jgi:hypothetical protein
VVTVVGTNISDGGGESGGIRGGGSSDVVARVVAMD